MEKTIIPSWLSGQMTTYPLYSSLILMDPNIKPDNKKPTNVWYSAINTQGSAYLEEKIGKHILVRNTVGGIDIVNESLVSTKHNWRE